MAYKFQQNGAYACSDLASHPCPGLACCSSSMLSSPSPWHLLVCPLLWLEGVAWWVSRELHGGSQGLWSTPIKVGQLGDLTVSTWRRVTKGGAVLPQIEATEQGFSTMALLSLGVGEFIGRAVLCLIRYLAAFLASPH